MPRFAYSAVDREGSVVKGEINAPSDIAAMDQLGRQGLTPVSLEEGGSAEPWWQRDISLFGGAQELKTRDQAQFFSTLHTMLSSGFTTSKALSFAANQASNSKTRRAFGAIADSVAAGGTLADALEDMQVAPARITGLVRIGEAANQLEMVAGRIHDMLATEMRNAQQVRQALIYPIILLAMSILVVLMLIFFLAPTLVPVFRSANVAPPPLLAALDTIGKTLVTEWPLALTALGGFLAALLVFRRAIASSFMTLCARLPGLRSYLRARDTLQFLQTLQLMLGSGAPLPAALGAAGDTARSPRWQDGIEDIRTRVEAGDTLSSALRASKLADERAHAFVEAGEEGDQLPDMLAQACRLLAEQTSGQLNQALRLITPLLTLIIGLTVGLLIFTTIGAILDLNDLAS